MSVAEFKEFLLQLSALYDEAAKSDLATALRNLAEVFDDRPNQKVARFLNDIRNVRGI